MGVTDEHVMRKSGASIRHEKQLPMGCLTESIFPFSHHAKSRRVPASRLIPFGQEAWRKGGSTSARTGLPPARQDRRPCNPRQTTTARQARKLLSSSAKVERSGEP